MYKIVKFKYEDSYSIYQGFQVFTIKDYDEYFNNIKLYNSISWMSSHTDIVDWTQDDFLNLYTEEDITAEEYNIFIKRFKFGNFGVFPYIDDMVFN